MHFTADEGKKEEIFYDWRGFSTGSTYENVKYHAYTGPPVGRIV